MDLEKLWEMYISPYYYGEGTGSTDRAAVAALPLSSIKAVLARAVHKAFAILPAEMSPMVQSVAMEVVHLLILGLVAYVAYKMGGASNNDVKNNSNQRQEQRQQQHSQLQSLSHSNSEKPTFSADLTSFDITFDSVTNEEGQGRIRQQQGTDKANNTISTTNKDEDDDEMDSKSSSDGHTSVLPPRKILGPKVTSIKFLVSAKPDQHINVFSPISYRSIRRLIEINFYNLTCTIHMPTNEIEQTTTTNTAQETNTTNATSPSSSPNAATYPSSKATTHRQTPHQETFLPGKQFPLSSIVNVHAVRPAQGVTLKITLELPETLLQLIPSSTVIKSTGYADSTAVSSTTNAPSTISPTSIDTGPPFHPSYDVLRAHHDHKDWIMQREIAKTCGFEEATTPPDDPKAALAVHGFTVDTSNEAKKGPTTKIETLEFVFQSAHDAALFQHHVSSLNLVGKEIRNLYNGLEYLNRIRIAKHLVPHILKNKAQHTTESDAALLNDPSLSISFFSSCSDDTKELLKKLGINRNHVRGVALDDVRRCLCSIPYLEQRIQSFYDAHFPSWRTLEDLERSELFDSTFYLDSGIRTTMEDKSDTEDAEGHTQPSSAATKSDRQLTTTDETSSTSVFTAAAQAQKDSTSYSAASSKQPIIGIIKGRCILGFSDFIYLFIGDLPAYVKPTATPSAGPEGIQIHRKLCRQAFILRKRVGRAALFVKHYIDAMQVVVSGWTHISNETGRPMFSDATITKGTCEEIHQVTPLQPRLAFDDDLANISHDMQSQNEYYEATVGKDVICNVHSRKHIAQSGHTTQSKIQAYALVGLHVFRFDTTQAGEDINIRLSPENDPVTCISSLYELIKSNPEKDFFVSSIFFQQTQTAAVLVFIRTLPTGVDLAFDSAMTAYRGDSNLPYRLRKQKLELFVQLGPMPQLSSITRFALTALRACWNWSRRRRGKSMIPIVNDEGLNRRPFPGMTVNRYTKTRHFPGALPNYLAFTSNLDAITMTNPFAKALYKSLPFSVIDFTFVLKGLCPEELPERALGTVRICQYVPSLDALPPPNPPKLIEKSTNGSNVNSFSSDHSYSTFESSVLTMERLREQLVNLSHEEIILKYRGECEALVDILSGVLIPVKNFSKTALHNSEETVMMEVPVLTGANAYDLIRYLFASEFDLKAAAVKLVESAAWRGVTFPVDKRACRIELDSGQFFVQGRDLEGNPVAYFNSMCPGPWRMDIDAQVLAVLHILESAIFFWSKTRALVQFTLVVLIGKREDNKKEVRKSSRPRSAGDAGEVSESPVDDDDNPVADQNTMAAQSKITQGFFNRRIDAGEEWRVHGNFELAQRLVNLAERHYPERFFQCLVVAREPRGSRRVEKCLSHILASFPHLRGRISVLRSEANLRKFISAEELAEIAGGNAAAKKSSLDEL